MTEPVTLADCPPGLFRFGEGRSVSLGFKTEYGMIGGEAVGPDVVFKVTNWPDAYVLASGEFFWGGVTTHEERAALMVTPIDPDHVADLFSHRDSWGDMLNTLVSRVDIEYIPDDDKSYWQHELKVFNRVFTAITGKAYDPER